MKRITEKRWFGPKYIGWGISPRSWEGWLVMLVWIVLTVLIAYYLLNIYLLSDTVLLTVYLTLPTIVLLIIMALTYGPDEKK